MPEDYFWLTFNWGWCWCWSKVFCYHVRQNSNRIQLTVFFLVDIIYQWTKQSFNRHWFRVELIWKFQRDLKIDLFFFFFFLNNSFECTNMSRINSHTLTTVQDYLHVIYYSNEDLLINCTILADWAHFIIHRLQDLNRIQGKKRAFDYHNKLTTGKIKRWNMLQKYLPIISAIKK